MRWVVWALCLSVASVNAAPKEKPTRPGVVGAQPPAGIAAPSGPIAQVGGGKVTLPISGSTKWQPFQTDPAEGTHWVSLNRTA